MVHLDPCQARVALTSVELHGIGLIRFLSRRHALFTLHHPLTHTHHLTIVLSQHLVPPKHSMPCQAVCHS